MDEIKIFENPEFGEVRTMLDEKGDVLFCAKDVASALGYAKPRNAVGTHCRGALKQGSPTSSGIQELSWIYEPDVYRLIIKSKLPAAEKFEAWLFEEVLPAIRKHGMYFTQDTVADIFQDPYKFKSAMDGFLAEYEKNKKLEKELELAQPKVEYYDKVIDSSLLTN
ncbi:MAG: BRO family protein [Eubacteriales bacterium]